MIKKISFFLVFALYSFSLFSDLYEPISVYLTWTQKPDSTMVIQWVTNFEHSSDIVEYRAEGDFDWNSIQGTHTRAPEEYKYYIHRVELENLLPDQIYEFRPEGSESRVYKFRTMPKRLSRPINFVAGGDLYHDDIRYVRQMNRRAAQQDPDFALIGGDIAYSAGRYGFLHKLGLSKEQGHRWITWLKAWKNDMVTSDGRLIPMIPTIGNHDVMGGYYQSSNQAPFFNALFAFPGTAGRGVLDFGNYLSLLVLNTGHTLAVEGAQTRWIEKTLAERNQIAHKFALYHVGAFPSVRSPKGHIHENIRKNWVPLFEKFNLSAAFEHHDHAYKRTHPIRNKRIDPRGVIYLGDGSWGIEKPRSPKAPKERWYIAASAAARNIIVVTLTPESRLYEAINDSGQLIDSYVQKL